MIHLTKETKHTASEIVSLASKFFGRGGLGLEEKTIKRDCIEFEGGGGYVSVVVVEEDDKRNVDIESREWEYHVKQFMEGI